MYRHIYPLISVLSVSAVTLGLAIPAGAAQPVRAPLTAEQGTYRGVPAGMHYEAPSGPTQIEELAVVLTASPDAEVLIDDPSGGAVGSVGNNDVIELAVVDDTGAAASDAVESDIWFQSVAATWPVGEEAPDLLVRVRLEDGSWSAWEPLTDDGAGPDAGQQPGGQLRAGTDTVFFGDSDAVQIATNGAVDSALDSDDISIALIGSPGPELVRDVPEAIDPATIDEPVEELFDETVLDNAAYDDGITDDALTDEYFIDDDAFADELGVNNTEHEGGSIEKPALLDSQLPDEPSTIAESTTAELTISDAVARPDSLVAADLVYRPNVAKASVHQAAAVAQPTIITRAQWGAAAPRGTWASAPKVNHAIIHHTAGSNSYSTQAQAMQQIRNDQAYHQQTRGWYDLGYNFVVDKWGNIYEGAAGSITSALVGAHTAGFNTGSVGISMLGDYSTLNPSADMIAAVAKVTAWRLSAYGVDAKSTITLTANSSNTLGWPVGSLHTVNTIAAHRDLGATACPGNAGYAQMTNIRNQAGALQATAAASPDPNFPADLGYLISDEQLYKSNSMTLAQITDFINSKGSNCRAAAGSTCLKDYRETTVTRPATIYCGTPYQGAANETAAAIIYKSAQACGINPQFLLVTLQKEQSLILRTDGATPETYAKAVGFRCPQANYCEPQYAGFATQIYSAASRIRQYALEPGNFSIKANANNTLSYGDASCGTATIFVRNQGTASLYNYTPLAPNPAGTLNCSPDGNLNFWRYYNQWFGNSTAGAMNVPQTPAMVTPSEPTPSQPATGVTSVKAGTAFAAGSAIRSPNGKYELDFQADGNVVLYEKSPTTKAIWATMTLASGQTFVFQSDGNFVIYRGSTPVVNTGTHGKGATNMGVTDAGDIVITNASGGLLWSLDQLGTSQKVFQFINAKTGSTAPTQPSTPTQPVSPLLPNTDNGATTVSAGKSFTPGATMKSPDGKVMLAFQTDGNVVLYQNGKATWATMILGTGIQTVFQTDGNLVTYQGGRAVAHTGSHNQGGTTLEVRNDGNIVIKNSSGAAIWQLKGMAGAREYLRNIG